MSGEIAKLNPLRHVHGAVSLPAIPPGTHAHMCAECGTWYCNSPYCDSGNDVRNCPEHGGPEPIQKGLEPWRGR